MPDLTGQIINNRYRVDAFIERGGMAEVYRVTDLQMGVPLAMKVLRADLAEDKDFIRRFQKEAQNLASLQHPNIVRFYRLEKVGRMVFMLLDYIDGSTLRGLLADTDAPLKADEILRWLEPVCRALNYAHLEKRVHCDIKPSNIMIDRKGEVFLSDFGIMRQIDTSTITMEGFGSPAYMAPELIRSENLSPATDIYSLGIVLYEMLTGGERPFKGDKAAITGTASEKVRWEQQRLEPPPPSHYNRNISRELDAVVLKCLAKEPRARYQAINEFMNDLHRAFGMAAPAGQEKVPVRQPVPAKPREKRTPVAPPEKKETVSPPVIKKRSNGIIQGIMAALVVLLIGYFLFSQNNVKPESSFITPTPGKLNFKAAMVTDLGGLSTNPDAKGYSDYCWEALLKAEKDFNIQISMLESKELSDMEPNLVKLASQGYDYIVGCGFLFTDAMDVVARKFPNTHFAIVDSVVDAPNVQSLVFAEEEGSFLVGAIAAGMSKTGTIGFLGGMELPLIEKFEAGYQAGAKSINPKIKVLSSYTGTFADVAKGKSMSLAQRARGADVIYPVAGACGLGTIEAAQEKGFWAIGVETDMDGYAKGSVLTSMIKHVEIAVYNSIKEAVERTFTGKIVISDLRMGGVGYSDLRYTRNKIPAELLAKVDQLAEMIKQGQLVVPTSMNELKNYFPPTTANMPTPTTNIFFKTSNAQLAGLQKPRECYWLVKMKITGFTPGKYVTVKSSGKRYSCESGKSENYSWDTFYPDPVDSKGELIITYIHKDYGTYNFTFSDSDGHSASLVVSYGK